MERKKEKRGEKLIEKYARQTNFILAYKKNALKENLSA